MYPGAKTGTKENAHRPRAPVVKAQAAKSLEEKLRSKAKRVLGLQERGRWTGAHTARSPAVRQPRGPHKQEHLTAPSPGPAPLPQTTHPQKRPRLVPLARLSGLTSFLIARG